MALLGRFRAGILLLLASTALIAQETRHEIVNHAANPADDTKSLSDNVPDVYAMTGHFDRVVILRFKYDTDLLAGMEKIVIEQKIRNAVILSAAGSLMSYHIHQVSNTSFPSRNMYEKNTKAPADLISMNGYVIDGRVHAHLTLARPDNAFGGHLEPGTKVFTFAIVTLGVLNDGVDLSRIDDKSYR